MTASDEGDEDKPVNIRIVVSPKEHQIIRAASALAGFRTMTDFIKSTLMDEAREVLRARGIDPDA